MWVVEGTAHETVEQAAQAIIENMSDDYYDEMLNEIYGEISVCGFTYDASYALYQLDEIAYKCGKNDYYDSLTDDIKSDLEDMDDGDEQEIYGVTVSFSSAAWESLKAIAEGLGWKFQYYDGYVLLENCSPLGEDICYEFDYSTIDDVIKAIEDTYMDFDPDEHVKELLSASEHGFAGVPTSVRALIDDAQKIDKMLEELWNKIQ